MLDLGTGPGVLAIESTRRWPHVHVVGVDYSSEMLARAQGAALDLADGERRRLDWVEGDARALPFADHSFHGVVSAFLYQFFPDRKPMLDEVRRVLKPGGVFGWVTWRAGPLPDFAPDGVADEVFAEMRLEWESEEAPTGRRPLSARAAAEEMRAAGFERVAARNVDLTHRFDLDSYLGQLEEDDAPLTFRKLSTATREQLRGRLRERLEGLPDDAFTWQRQLVSTIGRTAVDPDRES